MILWLLSLRKDLTSANARDHPQMKTATWTVVVVVFTLCITWVSCYSKQFLLMHTTGFLSVKTEGSEWMSTINCCSQELQISLPPEARDMVREWLYELFGVADQWVPLKLNLRYGVWLYELSGVVDQWRPLKLGLRCGVCVTLWALSGLAVSLNSLISDIWCVTLWAWRISQRRFEENCESEVQQYRLLLMILNFVN